MKVVIDTSVLIFMADPSAPAPLHPTTRKPVSHCRERVESLIEGLNDSSAVVIVPTPVLSELLIRAADRQQELLAVITGKRGVQVSPFDAMAAVENSQLRRSRRLAVAKQGETKKEVSFDLQVLAIARVNNADMVLTDDVNLRRRCVQSGMKVLGIADLPLSDAKRQIDLLLEHRSVEADDDEQEVSEGDSDP